VLIYKYWNWFHWELVVIDVVHVSCVLLESKTVQSSAPKAKTNGALSSEKQYDKYGSISGRWTVASDQATSECARSIVQSRVRKNITEKHGRGRKERRSNWEV